jgi:predicted RecA/RadA family phage recombinase
MEAIFVQDGFSIDYTPDADVAAGQVVVLGNVCFVAKVPIASGALGAVAATGVYDVEKTADLEIAAGDALFFNVTTRKITKTTSDVYFGPAVAASAAAATTVRANLRSLQAVAAGQLGLGNLSDVASSTATAGNVLVGNGEKFAAGKLGAVSLANIADGGSGLAFMITKTVTNGTGSEADIAVIESTPVKMKIVDAWLISRDTAAANVKLTDGTADITNVIAKGTDDDTIVRFTKLVEAKATLAAGSTIEANLSADGSVDICILAIPVA